MAQHAEREKLAWEEQAFSRLPFGSFCKHLLLFCIDPSAPLDLVLTPAPPELQASWKAGPGARDGYLLKLSGPVEKTTTLGPEALNARFPGPLPSGHYALELRALAGPHEAWAQASAWLAGESGLVGAGGSRPGFRPGSSLSRGPLLCRVCGPAQP